MFIHFSNHVIIIIFISIDVFVYFVYVLYCFCTNMFCNVQIDEILLKCNEEQINDVIENEYIYLFEPVDCDNLCDDKTKLITCRTHSPMRSQSDVDNRRIECTASYFVKIIWCSRWFCTPSWFETYYCFICSRRRMVVARYRLICLVLLRAGSMDKNIFSVFMHRIEWLVHIFFVTNSSIPHIVCSARDSDFVYICHACSIKKAIWNDTSD